MQCPHDQAKQSVAKIIDKLVERMNRMHAELQLVAAQQQQQNEQSITNRFLSSAAMGVKRQGTTLLDGSTGGMASPSFSLGQLPKGHLIIDLIATKKHVGAVPEEGLPFRLGHDIYAYIDDKYTNEIATTFVGLTDNTARRVGRDMFYTKSDDLSKTRIPFSAIDREHLFVIFPLQGKPEANESTADAAASSPPPYATRRMSSPQKQQQLGATHRPSTAENTAAVQTAPSSSGRSPVRGPVRFSR